MLMYWSIMCSMFHMCVIALALYESHLPATVLKIHVIRSTILVLVPGTSSSTPTSVSVLIPFSSVSIYWSS